MYLKKIGIHGLRNLTSNEVFLSPTSNFFFGENGSGKTSFLEGVHVLGRGRSFRSRTLDPVINEEEDSCTVFGLIDKNNISISLGVTRTRNNDFKFKMNGQKVNNSSSLADTMPLLLINSNSFRLLEGGPQFRRQYLDWGLFHVEHSYRRTLKNFKRALKQRNSLLRCDRINLELLNAWNAEFVGLAEEIDKHRKTYLVGLIEKINWVLSEITDLGRFDFKYYSGWDTDKKLSDILEADQQRDIHTRATTHGPQRSDLRISVDKRLANETLSRGQSKILVAAMQIAQGYLYHEKTEEQCLYLIDDLPSELDLFHRKKIGKLLWDLGAQTFVTGVLKEDLLNSWPKEDLNMKMFHVEHGKITQ